MEKILSEISNSLTEINHKQKSKNILTFISFWNISVLVKSKQKGVQTMTKNEVVKVFMERDGMSELEAQGLFNEIMEDVQGMLDEGDFIGAEEVFMNDTGLEPDYLLNVLM
jgi:hypothetical protein